jgi:DNA invertase Pin-like site-specific DNA recombinase
MARHRRALDPRLAVAYSRVSTDDQQLGTQAQQAAISAWAQARDLRVVAFHEDTTSGATAPESRAGLVAALEDLREHRASLLIVARRDRLARDVVVAAMIERAVERVGARVASADGTGNGTGPADEFMRTIVDGAAAYERALIRARTRAALAAKRSRGERVGTIPYGYRLAQDRVHLEVDAREQQVIAMARALRAEGHPLRVVVSELAARGFLSRRGRPFGLARVHAMTLV